ncbi:hypothetical protein PENDEC_c003G03796 [Penicillium decumbens]|uniref:Agd3 deacetylase domain-containing protein n=1 Tax=Penicillium decumbens TaxID=69771 RepID=A0A1V6PJW3_PENDC|nr:hypothetical protein PENDEC_c003G03796 [Penicillium decumbens]
MNVGSIYFPEVGHNGNGNIENSSNTDAGYTTCNKGAIDITNYVGDNTRPALLNTINVYWPYFTVTGTDGFDGMQVNPRWATRIYYNCDTPACTVAEWIATSAGSGTFDDLLAIEKADTMRHLFGLYHEGYMFHQANLRNADVDAITINGVSAKYSIFQA